MHTCPDMIMAHNKSLCTERSMSPGSGASCKLLRLVQCICTNQSAAWQCRHSEHQQCAWHLHSNICSCLLSSAAANECLIWWQAATAAHPSVPEVSIATAIFLWGCCAGWRSEMSLMARLRDTSACMNLQHKLGYFTVSPSNF